jgi:hypothetical protein
MQWWQQEVQMAVTTCQGGEGAGGEEDGCYAVVAARGADGSDDMSGQ